MLLSCFPACDLFRPSFLIYRNPTPPNTTFYKVMKLYYSLLSISAFMPSKNFHLAEHFDFTRRSPPLAWQITLPLSRLRWPSTLWNLPRRSTHYLWVGEFLWSVYFSYNKKMKDSSMCDSIQKLLEMKMMVQHKIYLCTTKVTLGTTLFLKVLTKLIHLLMKLRAHSEKMEKVYYFGKIKNN